MSLTIRKCILDNGLTVILKELHHAPAICCMIWYRVGSRDENPGLTGISHWVEHMMFNGTPSFPRGEFNRLLSREGGYSNAFTWLDHTAFFETVPADKVELCLRMEADRMINVIFSAADVETERSVILSERAMLENDPHFQLSEGLTATAFRVHPYRHDVIGKAADLERITAIDLQEHYQRYYVPSNAVLVMTGDFQNEEMLSDVRYYFEDIPVGESVERMKQIEPPQRKERRITVQGPGDTAYLTVAYRVPAAIDQDYAVLSLLNAAFTGGSSLGVLAGGGTNRSSRIYKALVDEQLAVSVDGQLAPTKDPYLYAIYVVVRAGCEFEEVELALVNELKRLTSAPVNQRELNTALRRARAQFIMAGESITGQAHLLGMAEATAGDFRWYESTVERLNKVTLDDLDRVRQTYLQEHNRTIGWYLPEKAEG